MTNDPFAYLAAQRQSVESQIRVSQQRMQQILDESKKMASGRVDSVRRAGSMMDRLLVVYKGVRIGLRVAAVVRALWPSKKGKKRRSSSLFF